MSEFIRLKNGPLVAAEAVALAVQLENDGHALSVREGKLIVTDGSKLAEPVRAQISRLRYHLMAIAAYKYEGPTP